MSAQDDSGSPPVDRIVEVHDDQEPPGGGAVDRTYAAGVVAAVLFALSAAGALAAGDVALATGLATIAVLFGAAVLGGLVAGG